MMNMMYRPRKRAGSSVTESYDDEGLLEYWYVLIDKEAG